MRFGPSLTPGQDIKLRLDTIARQNETNPMVDVVTGLNKTVNDRVRREIASERGEFTSHRLDPTVGKNEAAHYLGSQRRWPHNGALCLNVSYPPNKRI